MTERKTPPMAQDGFQPRPETHGYQPQPTIIKKGYQPIAVAPQTPNPQGGHIPTTGQGGSSTPPNQGSGGNKGS